MYDSGIKLFFVGRWLNIDMVFFLVIGINSNEFIVFGFFDLVDILFYGDYIDYFFV